MRASRHVASVCYGTSMARSRPPARLRARLLLTALVAGLGCSGKPASTPQVRELEPGVYVRQVTIDRPLGPVRVWLYSPTRDVTGPIGCVVVPPAGSNLISGMRLSEGDRREHVPYVEAGYVVASFDIDGAISGRSDREVLASLAAFRAADAGVADGEAALDQALATFPTIDRNRVFAAGHSSAATLALLLAAKDPRIKAVAAYAPVTDLAPRFPAEARQKLERALPGYDRFLKASSPITYASVLATKPVFLFHALDDRVADPEESARLFAAMTPRNVASTRVVVATGGHYGSMIHDGIPRAIAWLATLGKPGR